MKLIQLRQRVLAPPFERRCAVAADHVLCVVEEHRETLDDVVLSTVLVQLDDGNYLAVADEFDDVVDLLEAAHGST